MRSNRLIILFYSIYLKVEVSCNGNIPARVLGSLLEPSSSYEIENQSAVEHWDLVCNFVYQSSSIHLYADPTIRRCSLDRFLHLFINSRSKMIMIKVSYLCSQIISCSERQFSYHCPKLLIKRKNISYSDIKRCKVASSISQ